MAKKKKRNTRGFTRQQSEIAVEPAFSAAALAQPMASIAAQLADSELRAGHWRNALDYGEQARDSDPDLALEVIGEANFRLARRSILKADFATARRHAEQAVAARPEEHVFQIQLTLVRRAAGRVLRERDQRFFPDSIGVSSGQWWKQDLLARVRGWDDQKACVAAPVIMGEIKREHLEDIYALGTYVPWHEGGIPPRFTQYVRELKKHARTVPQAALLLWQGLTTDTASAAPDWIDEIDVVVPMATGWRSHEVRGHELTEQLAAELSQLLCLPTVDAFERDPDAVATHHFGSFRPRLDTLLDELRVKNVGVADLARARGVLIIDDVVTYGATFEACATRLSEVYPHLRCWGAALAYTQTQSRLRKALVEKD
jgi:hypothetical protein